MKKLKKTEIQLEILKKPTEEPIPESVTEDKLKKIKLLEEYLEELNDDRENRKYRISTIDNKDEFVNEFSNLWKLTTDELIRISKRYEINDNKVQLLPLAVGRKLKKDNLLMNNQVEQLKSIEIFHEGLSNDFSYPSISKLKDQINALKSLLLILKNIS